MLYDDVVFSHVFPGARDLASPTNYHDTTLAPLSVKHMGPFGNNWILYGKDKPAFIIARPGNGASVGFAVATPADVDPFRAAGLANGGSDEGAPGARNRHCHFASGSSSSCMSL